MHTLVTFDRDRGMERNVNEHKIKAQNVALSRAHVLNSFDCFPIHILNQMQNGDENGFGG